MTAAPVDETVQQVLAEEQRQRPVGSRLLHLLDALSASAGAAGVAAAASAVFLIGALISNSAEKWLTAFEALAAAVTLIMVFTLQHTQTRQLAALQRKLDELLRVAPDADRRAVHVETAPQETLNAIGDTHAHLRGEVLTRRSATDDD